MRILIPAICVAGLWTGVILIATASKPFALLTFLLTLPFAAWCFGVIMGGNTYPELHDPMRKR